MGNGTMKLALVFGFCAILLAGTGPTALANIVIDEGRGPVTVYVPSSYDPEVPTPLVCLLHGYGTSGGWQENYFQFLPLSEEYGFLYLHPDGTTDQNGNRFWNATDACCDFFGTDVDDSGYLMALVSAIEAQLNVDPQRIHFVGHSNGGFMSYRMACDHSETIAAIASLAGATHDDPADCSPAAPVHVLQIHGTSDSVIWYGGGLIYGNPYPGAIETVEQWAGFGGCELLGIPTPPNLDLDATIPGDETEVLRYATGCEPDGSAELWSIVGGGHSPNLSEDFSPLVIEYLLAHPKSPPTAVEGAWGAGASESGSVLFPASPSPFSSQTRLSYHLSEASTVSITVHDVAGRTVRVLVNAQVQAAGDHHLPWNGMGMNGEIMVSGVYLIRLETGSEKFTEKVILLR